MGLRGLAAPCCPGAPSPQAPAPDPRASWGGDGTLERLKTQTVTLLFWQNNFRCSCNDSGVVWGRAFWGLGSTGDGVGPSPAQ